MSTANELKVARAILCTLRENVSPAPWITERTVADLNWRVNGPTGTIARTGYVGNNDSHPHAHLIAHSRNSLDAQISILTLAIEYGELPEGSGSRFSAAALELAQAINGGVM